MTLDIAKLKALRERYSPQSVPKCHVCGAEMTAQRISGSRITYGCAGVTYDNMGCRYAPGRTFVDEHYEQSLVTVVDVSDPDVLELIASLEAAEKTSEARREALDRTHKMYQRERERTEAAEARIAELEAAPVAPVAEGETAVMPDYPGTALTQRECYRAGWEDRNAMLNQPVSQPYKLREGWIPCSERMPGRDGAYLTWDGRNVSNIPFFFGSWQANQFIARNITHWMPLPAAPGKEG